MSDPAMHLLVQTPTRVVFDEDADSIRLPTQTGQIGVRPGAEEAVNAVEAGIIVVRQPGTESFVGTAGGIMRLQPGKVSVLTPLAVTGNDRKSILDELEKVLAEPSVEIETRRILSRLEKRILQELRTSKTASRREEEPDNL